MDRYQLTDIIGSGGAGTVWAAWDRVLGRQVAVKDISAPLWCDVEGWPALRQRALREARAAAAIMHPNVVTVYDVVEEDSRPWIVMELIEARSLSQILDEDGPCPPRRVAEIGLQVLAALRAAHRAGIVHRDVKPSNVLVAPDGRAVLTDFGIASAAGEAALTAAGLLVGAPAYIAPERVTGAATGPASDLWSLGSTLYTAVEGRPPYRRDGAIDTISAVVHQEPDPTSRAGVLAPLLGHLLQRDPALRATHEQTERFLSRVLALGPDPGEAPCRPADRAAGTHVTPGYAEPDTAAAGPPAGGWDAGGGRPRGRALQRLTLLAAAATALLAVLTTGYLSRHAAEPGAPGSRPAVSRTVEPVQVVDPPLTTGRPPAARRPAVPATPPPVTTTTPAAQPPTTEPTPAQPSTPAGQPPPSASTPPPAPTTTAGGTPGPGGAAGPSGLP